MCEGVDNSQFSEIVYEADPFTPEELIFRLWLLAEMSGMSLSDFVEE